jgi:malonyl-CoA/methylmalonyl-CoA synthetase
LPNFVHDLRSAFERHAARPALVFRGETTTYAQLAAAARAIGGTLQELGIAAGDRVALFTDQKLPLLVANLGVWFAGGVPLPLNPRFTREEMRYYLSDSGARAVIAGPEQLPLARQLAGELEQPPVVVPDSAAVAPPAADFREVRSSADDPCLILYSSGTTGWPKGVVHTQSNVAHSLRALAACWRMTPDDVVVNVLPLFHIHGLAFATHLTWLCGGCVRLEESFDPRQTLAAIAEGTIFMAVPPIYYKLLEEPQFAAAAKTWNRLRLCTCGSAPIRTEVLPRLTEILGRPIINRYGMSEAYVITSLPLDGPWPDGSVGLPLDGVELRIAGDSSEEQAADSVGAVQIRGPNLFREYWNKPEATRAALVGGWFDTGDLGRVGATGMLTLVGRKHDLIITSGYNVYPQVVERVLGECPGVRECAVLGLPDQARGERVAAAIVRADSWLNEAVLRAWCQDRLVHYQQPKDLLFVDALPKNSLGKILRRELRDRFA